MSRSGYDDDCYNSWYEVMYRGAVKSALSGKRGQAFLRDMLVALDALPERKLIADQIEDKNRCVCALGAVGKMRGMDLQKIDPENTFYVAKDFGIAESMAREIVYENDEGFYYSETPEHRFARVRNWVEQNIKAPTNFYWGA